MENLELTKVAERKVAKANELIERARMNLTLTQQKLIAYIVSMIKPDDKDLSWYYISVSDFCELVGIDKRYFYTEMKEILLDLDKKSFLVENEDGFYNFRWFSEFCYEKNKAKVRVVLNSELKRYLIGLREHYTIYELYNILALKHKHSLHLYELFKSYGYKDIKYSKEIDLTELKKLLMCENYEYKNFRRYVLESSIEEINQFTDIQVIFTPIKKGRSVSSISFTVLPKTRADKDEAFHKTIDDINKRNKQIKGQQTIYNLQYESRKRAEEAQEED